MWREPIVNQFPYVMLLQRRILGDEAHCQAPRRITWCSWQSAKAMENLNGNPPSKAKRHNLVNLGSFCRSPTLQADSNVWNFHVSRAHHSHQSHPRLLRRAPLWLRFILCPTLVASRRTWRTYRRTSSVSYYITHIKCLRNGFPESECERLTAR